MSRRLQRLNVLLREEVSELIRRELRDPRLAEFVTLTRVSARMVFAFSSSSPITLT